ncbi:MAG: ABC transporter ATP-binding protein [Elusimicrobia bacterium]|nr:ABC transporter ATP-binding protein [Elusimicrobiota bacterium]
MDAVIEASKLVKRYGALTAVHGVDFEIQKGECFGLLGPNGAGKTTTVRMLCCTLPITEGDIRILGLSAREHPREIKARLGVCPQEVNLDPDFTVEKNLVVYSRYFDIPEALARRRARALIERFHLDEKSKEPIEDLSGGLKKRLLIARALVNEPAIAVLDEPTTGLDPQSKHQIWDQVGELKRSGTTVILTTHYMEEAALLCDHLIIMDQGRIIERGRPLELIEKHADSGGTLEDVFLKLTGRQLRE